MRFCIKSPPRPLYCAVFKIRQYVSTRAPRGRQRAFMQKSPTAEKKEFSGSLGGRTQKHWSISKDDSAAERSNAPFSGALHSDCYCLARSAAIILNSRNTV